MTEIEQLTIDVAAAFGQHPSETDVLAFRKKLEDLTFLEQTKAWIAVNLRLDQFHRSTVPTFHSISLRKPFNGLLPSVLH